MPWGNKFPDLKNDPSYLEGRLSNAETSLAENAQQVELFGAVGNGTTSDSIAFQNAIAKAVTTKNPAIKLQHGKTYLLNSSDVASYSGVSIFGNGAKIKFDGLVRFNIQSLSFFNLTDLEIETNVGLTEDATSQSNYQMFFYSDLTKQVLYNIQRVSVTSTVSQSPKVARFPTFFSSAYAKKGSTFSNLSFENVGIGLHVSDGYNYTVKDIYGTNIETLVYGQKGDSVSFTNLYLKNTQSQSLTWICKNNSVSSNGKDTLLIEAGVNNVTLDNLKGEFCIERVLYSQAGNVNFGSGTAINCGGFKFCGGSYSARKQNVKVQSITKIVTDDLTFRDDLYLVFDSYYVSNVYVGSINLINYRTDKKTQTGTYFISLADDLHNVTIDKITGEINTSTPMIYSYVVMDSTKPSSGIKINQMEVTNYGSSNGTFYLLGFGTGVPTNWIDGFTINNISVIQDQNQIITNNVPRYVNTAGSSINNINATNVDTGFLIFGLPWSGVASSSVYNNIIEFDVTHSYLSTGGSADYNGSYYSAYASGASTLYIPKTKGTQKFYAYYKNSDFLNKITTKYENLNSTALRYYDSIKEITFDMNMVSSDFWNLPINTTGNSYLVEVESSLGCGKAVISGNAFTVIYKTGNMDFIITTSKLQVFLVAGSGSDYYIRISNTAGTGRVKVKVTKV